MTKAESFLAQWDSAETAFEDPAKEYTCKTFKGDDDINVILIKYKCAGLTEEQWGKWAADPTVVAEACNNKLTRIELPDD